LSDLPVIPDKKFMIVFVLKINMYKIWIEPVIEERFDTDRTILILEFIEKQTKKNKRYYNKDI